jgi:DNA-directed RNA polymerase specialized sigma24 family protein
MPVDEAVTEWIEQLKEGGFSAAEKLWQRYFEQMVQLARRRLEGAVRAAADEEDVALSAFKSFCLGAREGRYPRLGDRNSLWSLLVAITAHKSTDLIRRENRKKRGGTGVQGSDREASQQPMSAVQLSNIIQQQPTPEFATQIGEQFKLLLAKLDRADDPDLMRIAQAKMLGESTTEVAQQLGCVRRTVERKILLIRRIWERECE